MFYPCLAKHIEIRLAPQHTSQSQRLSMEYPVSNREKSIQNHSDYFNASLIKTTPHYRTIRLWDMPGMVGCQQRRTWRSSS
jgi:hypothetical protein